MKRIPLSVDYLEFLANHFEHRDWNYTRLHNIKDIKYVRGYDVQNSLKHRFKMAFHFLFRKTTIDFFDTRWWHRFTMFIYCLKRDKNTPDGVLDEGKVITYWEETGEYLQMVQPSVGALLVEFLKEEPDNPHAKLIIAEMDRIMKSFHERGKNGEVTGEPDNG